MPLDPQIAAMLDGAPPWPGARNIPLNDLRAFVRQSSMAAGPLAVPLAAIRDAVIDGPGGPLAIRIYTPEGEGPFPLIVFFHGGGYVVGDLDTQDMIARALSHGSTSVCISVDYRLAPEHPFPAAADDAIAAVRWVWENAVDLNGDATRLVVAGDSAGANLSAVASLDARDRGGPSIAAQLLFYGSANRATDTESARAYADGPIITADDIAFFHEQFVGDDKDAPIPRAFASQAKDHGDLPPAFIATAECDPTRDDAEAYGAKLAAAGVRVDIRRYAGMPHGFVSWLGMVPAAQEAIDDASAFLAHCWAGAPA